jgi:hypothetical protein
MPLFLTLLCFIIVCRPRHKKATRTIERPKDQRCTYNRHQAKEAPSNDKGQEGVAVTLVVIVIETSHSLQARKQNNPGKKLRLVYPHTSRTKTNGLLPRPTPGPLFRRRFCDDVPDETPIASHQHSNEEDEDEKSHDSGAAAARSAVGAATTAAAANPRRVCRPARPRPVGAERQQHHKQ